ncbi:MAG: hypothetical protein WC810_27370 [Janthinobacterium sp.]|jgi:hypothetical protein
MKTKHYLLLIFLLASLWLAIFADKNPDSSLSDVQTNHPKTAKTVVLKEKRELKKFNEKTEELAVGRLLARSSLIGQDANKSRPEFFSALSWTPPAPPTPLVPPPRPPAPVVPPLPFQFVGKKIEDGVMEVYLAAGEKTYIVQNQSIIDNLYRVDSIRPPIMTLTYLPLKQVQTLVIGSAE